MAEEKQFENKVKRWLKSKEIYNFKYFANAFTPCGIPDIIACVNGRFVGIELKSEKGTTSPLQDYNLKQIEKSGGISMILRPSGFENFKKIIEELLK